MRDDQDQNLNQGRRTGVHKAVVRPMDEISNWRLQANSHPNRQEGQNLLKRSRQSWWLQLTRKNWHRWKMHAAKGWLSLALKVASGAWEIIHTNTTMPNAKANARCAMSHSNRTMSILPLFAENCQGLQKPSMTCFRNWQASDLLMVGNRTDLPDASTNSHQTQLTGQHFNLEYHILQHLRKRKRK